MKALFFLHRNDDISNVLHIKVIRDRDGQKYATNQKLIITQTITVVNFYILDNKMQKWHKSDG